MTTALGILSVVLQARVLTGYCTCSLTKTLSEPTCGRISVGLVGGGFKHFQGHIQLLV